MSEYEMGWQAGKDHAEQEHQDAVEAALAADREAALRDVFAAAALGPIMIVGQGAYSAPAERLRQARLAYAYADTMLEARKCC